MINNDQNQESAIRHRTPDKALSDDQKLHLIRTHLALVLYDKLAGIERDGEVVRATTGEIVDPTTDPSLGVQVCPGYREKIHRVKFALAHGWLPTHVDHVDGDRQNNRLDNLRAATAQQNARNTDRTMRKKSPFPRCVSARCSKSKGPRYPARVKTDVGKRLTLGTFGTPTEASHAVEEFLRELHGEFYREQSTADTK